MPPKPHPHPNEKTGLHPRNLHRDRYDFPQLIRACPDLASFVSRNIYGVESVDFADTAAVKTLNKALLKVFYGINFWDIPAQYLCPPVPGRADYLHYLADLLSEGNEGAIPRGKSISVLDIGVGANCIYPLLGHQIYGWRFVGTDIDPNAIAAARRILTANPGLADAITCRLQPSPSNIFKGILAAGERFDVSMCNPPFHASAEAAEAGTVRKWKNLGIQPSNTAHLNFGGQKTELWYPGGEVAFVRRMIEQSAEIPGACRWFSTLISKKNNLPAVYKALQKVGAKRIKTIEMAQGQKVSRMVAWGWDGF